MRYFKALFLGVIMMLLSGVAAGQEVTHIRAMVAEVDGSNKIVKTKAVDGTSLTFSFSVPLGGPYKAGFIRMNDPNKQVFSFAQSDNFDVVPGQTTSVTLTEGQLAVDSLSLDAANNYLWRIYLTEPSAFDVTTVLDSGNVYYDPAQFSVVDNAKHSEPIGFNYSANLTQISQDTTFEDSAQVYARAEYPLEPKWNVGNETLRVLIPTGSTWTEDLTGEIEFIIETGNVTFSIGTQDPTQE